MIKLKNSAVLLITLLFLFVGCQPEEELDPVFEPVAGATTLAEEPGLQRLLSDFLGTSHQGRTESAEAPFGTLDYSEITEFLGSEDQPAENYTIRLMPPEGVQSTREYLHLIADRGGYRGYIVQYIAAGSDSSIAFSQSSFTGTISALNLAREVQAVNLFENGVEVKDDTDPADENGREETDYYNCQCHYELADDDGIAWGPVTGTPIDTGYEGLVYVISCVCDQAPTFDNPNLGGGGGSPIGDPIDGGGFGGSSGSPGFDNGDNDGEPVGPVLGDPGAGDPVAVLITPPIPANIVPILEDEEFMEFMAEADCNLAWDFLENPTAIKGSILEKAYAIFKGAAKNIALLVINDVCEFSDEEKDQMLEIFQGFLDIAGFAPGVGELADGVNGVIYLTQGDYFNAALSGVSIGLPVAGDIGAKGLRMTIKVLKKTPGGDVLIKTAKEASFTQGKNLIKAFNKVVGDRLDNLLDDMIDNPAILGKVMDDPDLVDAWKKLDDLGVDDALRKNPEILSKVNDLYDPRKFQLPGNRPVVNGKKLDADFTVKTRDGKHDIYFDKNGFPDFEDFSLGEDFSFKPDGKVLDGSSSDFSKASDWLKNKYANNPNVKVKNNGSNIDVTINGQKNTYTWHHHQDGKTLMPVLTSVHSNVAHTGGAATIKRGLEGIFPSPY